MTRKKLIQVRFRLSKRIYPTAEQYRHRAGGALRHDVPRFKQAKIIPKISSKSKNDPPVTGEPFFFVCLKVAKVGKVAKVARKLKVV